VITPPPSVYAGWGSDATISVDAEHLLALSQQVQTQLQGIGNDLTTIFNTLTDLKLGWAGQSAQEAQDFFDRLDACLTVLYGKNGDQQSEQNSILGRVAIALNFAGNNYLAAEDAIVDLYYFTGSVSDTAIWNSHNNPNPGAPGTQNISDPTFTAISETF
jgi:hypothetical protein